MSMHRISSHLITLSLGGLGQPPKKPGDDKNKDKDGKKKWEPPKATTRIGKRKKRNKGSSAAYKLPTITPLTKCRLRELRLERLKDFLLLEEEYLTNQAALKPELATEREDEQVSKLEEIRGTPLSIGSIEEIIDDQHAIVSSSGGPDYYVNILSFVDRDQLEAGSTVLLHSKTLSVVGLLSDEVDPMVNVMKVEKAPLESYADIGGLEKQIQEVKEAVELPLTHPELYDDIGIKPPKGVIFYGYADFVLLAAHLRSRLSCSLSTSFP
jgi:26S proteasome regulatory subunit T2